MSSARDLSDGLAQLLRKEHAALGDFLVALAGFDRARGWVELGYTSLFYFLHRELGLSAGAAYQRKVAAELLQRFPAVEAALREGRLCLSSVAELARVLTPGNEAEVLPRFFRLSAREAKEVAAELAPRPVVPTRTLVTVVRAAPLQAAELRTSETLLTHPAREQATAARAPDHDAGAAAAVPLLAPSPPRPRPADKVEPLTADLRRLNITVSKRVLEKLEAARDGLSHAIPGATTEQVLEAALDALLAKQAARRGLVKRPRKSAPAAEQRRSDSTGTEVVRGREDIPAAVKREVWTRDDGRCQWPMESGGFCGATRFLELDHVVPVARGGLPISQSVTCPSDVRGRGRGPIQGVQVAAGAAGSADPAGGAAARPTRRARSPPSPAPCGSGARGRPPSRGGSPGDRER